jgi:hypothetical protein
VAWTYPRNPQEQGWRQKFISPFNWRIFDDFQVQ